MRLFFRKQAVPIDAPPDGTPFDSVLDRELPDPAPLAEAMAYVRENLSQAENLGQTGDAKDYYHHLDVLAEGVAKSFPTSFCKAGCSGCCYYPVGLFTLTYSEWIVMRHHMDEVWTESQRLAFAARYRVNWPDAWRFVISMLQNSFVGVLVTAPALYRARKACPFLLDNKCSIYAARPYQCRTFGLFAARTLGRDPKVYACNMQGENLLTQLTRSGPQLQLPVMNPIVLKIRRLCRGPKLSLPIWAGIWVEKRYPIR